MNIIEPQAFVAALQKDQLLPALNHWPENIVIRFSQSDLKAKDLSVEILEKHRFLSAELVTFKDSNAAVLNKVGLGAPQLAVFFETLCALGSKKFISIGTAGSLKAELSAGEFVLCTKSWADEGLSSHYGFHSDFIFSNESLNADLRKSFANLNHNFHDCASWTTDAFFRETAEKVNHFRSIGISTVEMEASALFALAQYRRVKATSLFVVADNLANVPWSPQFRISSRSWSELLMVALNAFSS